jgi:hypothetical protein
VLLGVIALVLGTATAGGPEIWASQYDGRLSQAMDRNPTAAISIYETILGGMPEADPLRGEVLYWLGRARWSFGDAEGAMETLKTAETHNPSNKGQATALLGRLKALDTAIKRLPFTQDFRRGFQPLVRGWGVGKRTDLRIIAGPDSGDAVAAWQVSVRDGGDDFLTFALDTGFQSVQRLRMSLMARAFPMHIRFLVEDVQGRRWTGPIQIVETDTWTAVDLNINRLVSASAPAAGQHPNGRELRWVVLRDVTAVHAEDRGENELLIDDLGLR